MYLMRESLTTILLSAFILVVQAQSASEANYDEAKVPSYNLPAVLETSQNQKVKNKRTWEKVRRPEILKLFEDNIYGQMPKTYSNIKYEVTKEDETAMSGK